MSFQDIETGLSQPPHAPSTSTPQSREERNFQDLQASLAMQVFKINANVQNILKRVDRLGTTTDNGNVRKELHNLTETTRDMAKRGSDDLKKLAELQVNLPKQKTALQKTSHDFQLSLVAFQRAQKHSAERQRTVVEGVKVAVDDESQPSSSTAELLPGTSPQQEVLQQAQVLQKQLSPQQLAYQESLIQEREDEIREIETGIHELSEIFRDLGTLVNEQGDMIDNIESNISSIALDTSSAAEELSTASEYQRRAGRRAACLMIVVVIVVCIVLLAVLS
ncbi:t-SNARE [Schizopora paradoxa]|uniref:t-SNARE n=1 Tax=Schizopora paradoxa TaxID=27342 RepID=A0A0H2RU83_9AGAM|nr:t-SNARE [Schizopora paradoxa]